MSDLFTIAWVKGAAERAVKTAAQSLAGAVGVGVGLTGVNWTVVGSFVAATTLASICTSIASSSGSVAKTSDPKPVEATDSAELEARFGIR